METEYQKRNCLFLDEREIGLVGETDVLKGKSNSQKWKQYELFQ